MRLRRKAPRGVNARVALAFASAARACASELKQLREYGDASFGVASDDSLAALETMAERLTSMAESAERRAAQIRKASDVD